MLISNLLSSFKLVHCKYIYRERETAGGVCEKERERQHETESRGKKDRKREERKTNR